MKMIKYFMVVLAFGLGLAHTGDASAREGLKKTVAVIEFKNDSGWRNYGRLGYDFSMRLSDALIQTGKVAVMNRQNLDAVMAEQNLANSGRAAQSKTAQIGKIVPAQILVKGRIMDFEKHTGSGTQGLKIKGISFGTKRETTSMGVIVQIINSATGEIIDSKRVEGEARSAGLSVGYSGPVQINTSDFKKTPDGLALQMAIDRAVVYITNRLADVPWEGKVVTVKDGKVFINSGKNVAIEAGDTFAIYRQDEELIDPDTGISLGSERSKIADVKVLEVKDKFSKAEVIGTANQEIGTGDLVVE